MARPTKTGLDYYPMDTRMDDNMEILEAKHGIAGFGVMVKLYQKIYAEGYYIDWDEDTKLLFCKRVGVDIQFVDQVIETAFKREMLSREKYDSHNILTGRGIQKRFFTACKHTKRKTVPAIKDYICVNGEYTEVITELIEVNPEETKVNTEFSTQKKVKEKKRNTSDPNFDSFDYNAAKSIWKHVDQLDIKAKLPKYDIEGLRGWADEIRKMREIDNYTEDEIRSLFSFFTKDDFWHDKIRSGSKFREKAEDLMAACKRSERVNVI